MSFSGGFVVGPDTPRPRMSDVLWWGMCDVDHAAICFHEFVDRGVEAQLHFGDGIDAVEHGAGQEAVMVGEPSRQGFDQRKSLDPQTSQRQLCQD